MCPHLKKILCFEEKSFSIFVYKIICMKRILIYAAGFVFIAFSFTSCQKNCKVCQQNTYDSGGNTLSTGSETEYCDAALLGIEATPDVTVGGVTTKWVCR
jgi:hypothetical protein